MANIQEYLNKILLARFGKDVRGSIHDAIQAMNTQVEDSETSAGRSAISAAESAEKAKESAESIGNAEEVVLQYANAAQESATEASNSADSASISAKSSLESANLASASEQEATAKAREASESAANARQSESNAENYATNASNSAASASESASTANDKATEASESATQASESAGNAASSANDSSTYATQSKSYAEGGTGTRTGEDTDNAKYYNEQAQKALSEMQKSHVTGVKGNEETEYRTGEVNITAENVGAVKTGGDVAENTVTYESNDCGPDGDPALWEIPKLTTGEKLSSLMQKVSRIANNFRYFLKLLGTNDISSLADGTVTGSLIALNDNLTYHDLSLLESSTPDEGITVNSFSGSSNKYNGAFIVVITNTVEIKAGATYTIGQVDLSNIDLLSTRSCVSYYSSVMISCNVSTGGTFSIRVLGTQNIPSGKTITLRYSW